MVKVIGAGLAGCEAAAEGTGWTAVVLSSIKTKEAWTPLTAICVMGFDMSICPSVLGWKRVAAGSEVLVSSLRPA